MVAGYICVAPQSHLWCDELLPVVVTPYRFRSRSGFWAYCGLGIVMRSFKGAAMTVIGRSEDGPLYRHYESLLDGGTKPNLAKLMIARQIASITLALWRTGERYDPTKLEAVK